METGISNVSRIIITIVIVIIDGMFAPTEKTLHVCLSPMTLVALVTHLSISYSTDIKQPPGKMNCP
jgi:hypothetical protein